MLHCVILPMATGDVAHEARVWQRRNPCVDDIGSDPINAELRNSRKFPLAAEVQAFMHSSTPMPHVHERRAAAPSRVLRTAGDGLDLHVEVAGEGPPVILLHGFPENGHSWRRQIAPLVDAGFSAWVPNLRGYPPSAVSPRQGDYHLRYLANDVAAIVEASGHARAHVVGHDWGGIVAWTFAGLYPQLLDRLVIMNAPHMALYSAKVWHTSQLLRSWYAAFFQLPLLPEAVLAADRFRIVREIFRHGPARAGAFGLQDIACYVDCLSHPGALKAALDYYRENMRSDGMALAASVRTDARTLVLWGERDPTLGVFLLSGLARYAPHVRIHRIALASHWVQNEAPEQVNRVMTAFLREP